MLLHVLPFFEVFSAIEWLCTVSWQDNTRVEIAVSKLVVDRLMSLWESSVEMIESIRSICSVREILSSTHKCCKRYEQKYYDRLHDETIIRNTKLNGFQ